MKKLLILCAASTMFFSCKKDESKAGTFKGPEKAIHVGKGFTWIKVDADGKPEQLAISINQAALNSLPIGNQPPPDGHNHNIIRLAFDPIVRSITPFDHIQLDWNPSGHPPLQFYSKEHFDFHFYMETEAQVAAAVDQTKLNSLPGAEYLPANYQSVGPVPQMGTHFIDVTSPEFNNEGFTQTFIYGSYDGKVTFYEPMITLDFLKQTTTFERAIPQPAKFKVAGFYPTKMRITKQGDLTNVILEAFVKRDAS